MDSHALSPFGSDLKAYKLHGLGMPNMNFLTADVIQFLSGTMTTFSHKAKTNKN